MPELRVLNGPLKGANFCIGAGITTIGRGKTNSICIEDMEMSRQHAELHVHREEFVLVDLTSFNGSKVNGANIERQLLQEGDQVQLGQTLLEFRSEHSSSLATLRSESGTVENFNHETRIEELPVPQDASDELLRVQSNLDVLYQSALATGSFQNTQTLLQRILDLVFYWSSATRACILLRENDIDTWIAKSVDPSSPSGFLTSNFQVNHLIIKHVFRSREGVLVNSVYDDKRFVSDSSLALMKEDLQIICAPIIGRNGMRGIIYADREVSTDPDNCDDSFQDQQLKLMSAVGLHAAVAIESSEHYSMILQSERVTAVGNTLASLSHHIKNILQSINGGNHLIEAGIENQEFELVKNGWKIVGRNQESLTQLVMDMLYFGKPIDNRPAPTSLERLVNHVIRHCHRLFEDAPEVEVSLASDLPKYWLDRDLITRALQNILLFVFRSWSEEQKDPIRLSVGPVTESSQTVLSITFTGSPLKDSELATMFDPSKLSGQSSSFGIGMAVARKILREAGADVTIQALGEQNFRFEVKFEKMHLLESVKQSVSKKH